MVSHIVCCRIIFKHFTNEGYCNNMEECSTIINLNSVGFVFFSSVIAS